MPIVYKISCRMPVARLCVSNRFDIKPVADRVLFDEIPSLHVLKYPEDGVGSSDESSIGFDKSIGVAIPRPLNCHVLNTALLNDPCERTFPGELDEVIVTDNISILLTDNADNFYKYVFETLQTDDQLIPELGRPLVDSGITSDDISFGYGPGVLDEIDTADSLSFDFELDVRVDNGIGTLGSFILGSQLLNDRDYTNDLDTVSVSEVVDYYLNEGEYVTHTDGVIAGSEVLGLDFGSGVSESITADEDLSVNLGVVFTDSVSATDNAVDILYPEGNLPVDDPEEIESVSDVVSVNVQPEIICPLSCSDSVEYLHEVFGTLNNNLLNELQFNEGD